MNLFTGNIFTAQELTTFFADRTKKWAYDFEDIEFLEFSKKGYENIVLNLHYCNFFQWDRETKVRIENVGLDKVAAIKREIDVSNYRRSEMIQRIDDMCAKAFELKIIHNFDGHYLNSETIGQMTDRLSILVLKKFYMDKNSHREDLSSEIRDKCSERVLTLDKQISYISYCYETFLSHLKNKTGYMSLCRNYKTYSDQDLY